MTRNERIARLLGFIPIATVTTIHSLYSKSTGATDQRALSWRRKKCISCQDE